MAHWARHQKLRHYARSIANYLSSKYLHGGYLQGNTEPIPVIRVISLPMRSFTNSRMIVEMIMTRGMPSLAALLGRIAVAGYQNRDKIGEFIKGLDDPSSPAGRIVGRVKRGMEDSPMTINMKEGVGELVDRFKQGGHGPAADSWVVKGPNSEIDETQLEKALGSELINGLVRQTGLNRKILLSRLALVLPETIDKLTPKGRLPD
jgi:uncharacterized protein YidB (DUF937 family)